MEKKLVKKFDKNSGKFISTKIELSEVLKNNPPVGAFNLSRFKQKTFIDKKDLEIINSLKEYIDNFDFTFFDRYKKNENAKLFKEKLYALDRRIEFFLQVKKSKDNAAIQNAISLFKQELKGYKVLKNSLIDKLTQYKYEKRQINSLSYKRFYEDKKVNFGFGLASYGSVLSIYKGKRNSH